jgi:hypothetical protein
MTVLAGCTTTMTMLKEEQGLSFLESTGFDFLAIDSSGQFHTKK